MHGRPQGRPMPVMSLLCDSAQRQPDSASVRPPDVYSPMIVAFANRKTRNGLRLLEAASASLAKSFSTRVETGNRAPLCQGTGRLRPPLRRRHRERFPPKAQCHHGTGARPWQRPTRSASESTSNSLTDPKVSIWVGVCGCGCGCGCECRCRCRRKHKMFSQNVKTRVLAIGG